MELVVIFVCSLLPSFIPCWSPSHSGTFGTLWSDWTLAVRSSVLLSARIQKVEKGGADVLSFSYWGILRKPLDPVVQSVGIASRLRTGRTGIRSFFGDFLISRHVKYLRPDRLRGPRSFHVNGCRGSVCTAKWTERDADHSSVEPGLRFSGTTPALPSLSL